MSDILRIFHGADAWRWYAVPPSIYLEFDIANRYGFYGYWDIVKLNFLSNFRIFIKPFHLSFVDAVIDELARHTDESSGAFGAYDDSSLSDNLAEILGDSTKCYIDAGTQLFIETTTRLIPICIDTYRILDGFIGSQNIDVEILC